MLGSPVGDPMGGFSQQEAQQLGLPERKAITERLEGLKKLEEVEVGVEVGGWVMNDQCLSSRR